MTMIPSYDLWAEDHKPTVEFRARQYVLRPPGAHRTSVIVEVDGSGMLEIIGGLWFGTPLRSDFHDYAEKHALHKQVYDWMREWELATMRMIGPEDSEWFATKNLDPEWGYEV